MQVNSLQSDLDRLIEQQDQVERVKGEVERTLESELQSMHAQLDTQRREHERDVNELLDTVTALKDKLRVRESEDRTRARYETKIAALKAQHADETRQLIRRFESEKQSALDILRAKLKSEMNSLIPQLKEQFKAVYARNLQTVKVQVERSMTSKYESVIRGVKEEHRRGLHQALGDQKARLELELRAWKQDIKDRYEQRLLEVRNETERKLLNRFRHRL